MTKQISIPVISGSTGLLTVMIVPTQLTRTFSVTG